MSSFLLDGSKKTQFFSKLLQAFMRKEARERLEEWRKLEERLSGACVTPR